MGPGQVWVVAVTGSLLAAIGGCVDQREAQPSETRLGRVVGMDRRAATDRVGERDVGVDLEAMRAIRPGLEDIKRNPFLFATGPVGEPAGTVRKMLGASKPSDVLASEKSTEDVLSLRFIGIVEARRTVGLIAVLTDGRVVFQGAEGDTLEGRYRIANISRDRVEIEVLPAGTREVLYREGV